MSVVRFVLGLASLALGGISLLARDRIVARHRARDGRHPQPRMLWIVMGWLYLLIGACWVASVFV